MKTRELTKRLLRNLEHFQFAQSVLTICQEANIGKINGLLPALKEAIESENQMLNLDQKEMGTTELTWLNRERSRAYRTLSLRIKAALLAPQADIQKAAAQLKAVQECYPRLLRHGYLQQTGGIRNLITDLREAAVYPSVVKLNLGEAVDRMESANKAFDTLYLERVKARPNPDRTPLLQLRTQTDDALNAIARRMNSLLDLEPDAAIEALVNRYNALVKKLKIELKRRSATGSAATAKRKAETEELLRPHLEELKEVENLSEARFAGRSIGTGKTRCYLIAVIKEHGEVEDRWYRAKGKQFLLVPDSKLPKPRKRKKATYQNKLNINKKLSEINNS